VSNFIKIDRGKITMEYNNKMGLLRAPRVENWKEVDKTQVAAKTVAE